jgi:hypothetical protein
MNSKKNSIMSNGNLSDIGINLKYTKGMILEYFRYNGYPHSSSYAMTWCMMATGVYRVFSRDDMREFLFRLPVALNSLGLVETWLMKDHLMDYRVKEKLYTLSLNEVYMNFGLEIADVLDNATPREKYMESVSAGINSSMYMGILADFSVIEPGIREDGTKVLSGKKKAPAITPELIEKAEFFAKDLMKFIPEETFSDPSPLIAEKEKEIERRKELKRKLPVFDIKKIPRYVIKKCVEFIFVPEYAQQLLNDKEKFAKEARPLIYLAWLMANDLLNMNGPFTCPREGVPFNYDDYLDELNSYNLEETIETYNLAELAGELRGVGTVSHYRELVRKLGITEKEIASLAHLYTSGIDLKVPYYNDGLKKIEMETGFRDNHEGSLDVFDRIFAKHGMKKTSGLARRFTFDDEAGYYDYMKEIGDLMLMAYYAKTMNITDLLEDN